MRRLMAANVVRQALLAGTVLAAACLPFLTSQAQPRPLLLLRVALLFPVAIVLFQAALAWTPLAEGRAMWVPLRPLRTVLAMAGAAAVLAALYGGIVDPHLSRLRPDYFPKDLRDWCANLPWVVGFQPLVLVAGVYAFTVRLAGKALIGTAAVVVVRQAAFLHHWQALPSPWLVPLLLLAGAHGLLLAFAYRRLGYAGLVVVTLVIEARFLPALLTSVSGG